MPDLAGDLLKIDGNARHFKRTAGDENMWIYITAGQRVAAPKPLFQERENPCISVILKQQRPFFLPRRVAAPKPLFQERENPCISVILKQQRSFFPPRPIGSRPPTGFCLQACLHRARSDQRHRKTRTFDVAPSDLLLLMTAKQSVRKACVCMRSLPRAANNIR